jgi:hypothetical protein
MFKPDKASATKGVRRQRRHAALQLAHATWKASRPPCLDFNPLCSSLRTKPQDRDPRLFRPHTCHPCTSNESNDNHIASILTLLLQVPAVSASPRLYQQQPQWTFDEPQHPCASEIVQCSFASRNREVTTPPQPSTRAARMVAVRQAR